MSAAAAAAALCSMATQIAGMLLLLSTISLLHPCYERLLKDQVTVLLCAACRNDLAWPAMLKPGIVQTADMHSCCKLHARTFSDIIAVFLQTLTWHSTCLNVHTAV